MTDYLNPDKLYISGRIDIAPGFDSFRDTATDGKPHPDNGVPTVKESLTTALDENGLARCGCGEKAGFHYSVIVDNDCYVECGICGEHTKVAPNEEKARDAWNAALRGSQPDPDTGPEGSIRKREKMRSVKKETMDELARITRKYWATGDKDILAAKNKVAYALSEQAFGRGAKWIQFCDILDGAIYLNQHVSNDTIYKIFFLLGINVSAPVEDGAVALTTLTE